MASAVRHAQDQPRASMDELNEAGLCQPIRVSDHLVDREILAELGHRGAEDVDVATDVGILARQIDNAATLVARLQFLHQIRHDSLLPVIGRHASLASTPGSSTACQPGQKLRQGQPVAVRHRNPRTVFTSAMRDPSGTCHQPTGLAPDFTRNACESISRGYCPARTREEFAWRPFTDRTRRTWGEPCCGEGS